MKIVGWVIRLLVLAGIILVGVAVYLSCSGGSCVQRIDKMPPEATEAPWMVKTPTHIYYTKEVVEDENTVSLSGWYEYIDKKWVLQKGKIELSKSLYGKVVVVRR